MTCGKKVGGIVYGGEDGTEGNKDSHSFEDENDVKLNEIHVLKVARVEVYC